MNNRVLHGLFIFGSLTLIGCSSSPVTEQNVTEQNATQQDVAVVNSANAETVASWVESQVLSPVGLSLQEDNIRFLTGSADLNKDGNAEHMVLMQGQYFCGSGGCTGYLFDNNGQMINSMTVVKTPVVLADSFSNGWQDFMVWSDGSYRLMSYNGESYPSNPSLEPKVARDTDVQMAIAYVMATEVYQKDGYDIRVAQAERLWTSPDVYHFTFKHHADPHSNYKATVNLASGEVDVVSEPSPQ